MSQSAGDSTVHWQDNLEDGDLAPEWPEQFVPGIQADRGGAEAHMDTISHAVHS